ncbi:MOSC domain-containing protein [Microcoleus sp. FACHB-SPT15]|uniref:MOSC domain-containing protein n=1 Tax=Microcoleus sp. FACHB-SPT15 TaxID=2692830 RepID=UPI001782EE70|nr:MOSC domain-containing protein [Microcoleus sp. FACHB-SPT15]MBD1805401.1 MOSC domain-containing protein [Microcoleus sp. FACHB-SPT15]
MAQIKLSGIYIYPIKSARGISLETAQVENRGFQYDRRWMLVDETGKFMTQRKFPRMALIGVRLEGNQLIVEAPNHGSIAIPTSLDSGDTIFVQVWNDVCEAISLTAEVNQWFSEFLGTSCQLVFMPERSHRLVSSHYSMQNELVSFADAFPFLLTSEASLQDLNERLDEPVPMNRFRPNLVVSGCEAFAEDTWRQIRIGSILFHVVKGCDRCVVTTIDQTQGIRGKEPLVTLAKYRLWDRKVWFGQNLVPSQLGTLEVGDSVEIQSLNTESLLIS